MSEEERKRPRLSLSAQVLLGLLLGVATGAFFGELVGFLAVVGDVFIRLLQMTVLPYVAVSLVTGLGGLDYRSARGIALRGGLALLVFSVIPLVFVLLVPLAFPDLVTASFFSTSIVEEPAPVDLLGLYIPSNPFYSIVNNLVPAVVLFSIVVGAALIAIERKTRLLEPLNVFQEALMGVTTWVAMLAPYGVFALTASATGTLRVDELARLQVYLISYITAALVLTFWVLPGLIAVFTPLRVRDVLSYTREPLVTAFAIGNLLIVLPILARQTRRLVEGPAAGGEGDVASADVLVPTSFSFPSSGKILALLFLPFAAWFAGQPIGPEDYAVLLTAGPTSFFAQTVVAVPFLLDLLRLPADLFQLFVAVDVFTGRFGVMLAAMFIVCVALLGTFAGRNRRTNLKGLLRYAIVTLALVLATVVGLRLFFAYAISIDYEGYSQFVRLELRGNPVEHRVVTDASELRREAGAAGSRLRIISERGSLRVCYFRDALPFAFVNEAGHLVGHDVEMAHDLARQLGTSIDFVQVPREGAAAALNGGTCDIVMSGWAMTAPRAREVLFSNPSMRISLAFVVRDHLRLKFGSWRAIEKAEDLRIGIASVPYYRELVKRWLPNAEIVSVESPSDFFTGDAGLDAMIYAAEPASAWTLIYPSFSVVVPRGRSAKAPLAYGVPRHERELFELVNVWLELKRSDGSLDRTFSHWILGEGARSQERRWSVARDVLHWID